MHQRPCYCVAYPPSAPPPSMPPSPSPPPRLVSRNSIGTFVGFIEGTYQWVDSDIVSGLNTASSGSTTTTWFYSCATVLSLSSRHANGQPPVLQVWLKDTNANQGYMDFYRPTASAYGQSSWDFCADFLNSGPNGKYEGMNDIVAGEPSSTWMTIPAGASHHRGGTAGSGSGGGSCEPNSWRLIWGNTGMFGGYCGSNGGWSQPILFYIY